MVAEVNVAVVPEPVVQIELVAPNYQLAMIKMVVCALMARFAITASVVLKNALIVPAANQTGVAVLVIVPYQIQTVLLPA